MREPTPHGPAADTAQAPSAHVLRTRVHATSYAHATRTILAWTRKERARYVCVANVHMLMEAEDDPSFLRIVNEADLVTPDGVPLVWALRARGIREATRVYGPTLTLHLCAAAAEAGIPVGFYGGREHVVGALTANLTRQFPGLRIAYAVSPPFRTLTDDEDRSVVEEIRASGTRLLFVGLGCPKQERWMAAHEERLPLVQVGVGAAFDFHAGALRQAPAVLQNAGLEWAFRFSVEPRRLFTRYARHNPRFVLRLGRQLLRERLRRP